MLSRLAPLLLQNHNPQTSKTPINLRTEKLLSVKYRYTRPPHPTPPQVLRALVGVISLSGCFHSQIEAFQHPFFPYVAHPFLPYVRMFILFRGVPSAPQAPVE